MEAFRLLTTLILVSGTVRSEGHVPVFLDHHRQFTLTENSPIGTVIGQITATDQDGAENLHFNTADNATAELITVENERRTGNEITADVALKTLVDRDFAPSNRDLSISVTDGTHKVVTKYILVITDVNDNAPNFTLSEYRTTMPRSQPVGSIVLTVLATDPDESSGGVVTYSIQTDDLFAFQALRVNQYTGVITLHSPLITHASSELHLRVIATVRLGHFHCQFMTTGGQADSTQPLVMEPKSS